MDSGDPVALQLVRAIHSGDTSTLGRLLAEHPGLASEPIQDRRVGDAASDNPHTVQRFPGPRCLGVL